MKNKVLAIISFFFTTHLLCAQFNKAQLDTFFDTLEKNQKFNGSVALSENGKIIYERSLGFADFETKTQNNADTKFRIGSISKTFTAALILKAEEEGKLNLEQKIDLYFPTIKNANKITIENLLNHRSGIHSFTDDSSYLEWNTQPKTKEELIALISNYNADFEPDSKADYSNSNYVLLSFILEEIYGKSYAEILNEKIIQPLGLKNTKFGGEIKVSNKEANSYKFEGNWVKESETDTSIPMGAGGIISTPENLIKFGESLFDGKLISENSVLKMKEIKDGFGLGLFTFPFNDKKAWGHTGGIDGFSSMWGYFPNEKVSMAIISNGTDFNNNDIAIAMLSAVFNVPIKIPSFTNPENVVPGYTGVFSNSQLGMKITVTENEGTYFAQAEGQSAFPLEKLNEFDFKFDLAGIQIQFAEDLKSFTLLQGGGKFLFLKE